MGEPLFVADPAGADWESLSERVSPRPFCTALAVADPPRDSGAILLPESAADRLAPDCGIVAAAGPGVALIPGDRVLFDTRHGKWMERFPGVEGFAVFLGCAAKSHAEGRAIPVRVPWNRSVLAVMEMEGDAYTLRATMGNVVVDRGDVVDRSVGGLWLPDSATWRESMGTVVSVGAGVDGLEPGDVVVYMANLMRPVRHAAGVGAVREALDRNLGIVPAEGVLAKVVR